MQIRFEKRKMKIFLIIIIIINFNWPTIISSVKTKDGEIVGTSYSLKNGRIVHAFLGIPYAAPPVNEYRFKEPKDLKPWDGIWNATIEIVCLQIGRPEEFKISGEEDCLYLNVYTSKLPTNEINPQLNVHVQIHGGAYSRGRSYTIYPDYLLYELDIVYVSINFRLGILGFLSTGDSEAPGNFGFKDQVAALKWIQRNIIYFGGNPNRVTIAGGSCGADSVQYHYISPLSKGLFQRGISSSGSVLRPSALPANIVEKSMQVAALVGCPTNDTRIMLRCLQSRPAHQLVSMTRIFYIWLYVPTTVFGPVVEPDSPNAFLSSTPFQLLKNGKVDNLPWMPSFVTHEGLFPAGAYIERKELLEKLDKEWYDIVPYLLAYNFSMPKVKKDSISAAIRKFYFGEKRVSKTTAKELVEMSGDRLFIINSMIAIKLHNMATENDIYCYNFKYRGKFSASQLYTMSKTNHGVCHSDDLIYYLDAGVDVWETESDRAVSKLMISIVLDFMETGNPSIRIPNWKPMSKNKNEGIECLSIYSATHQVMENIFNETRAKFWGELLPLQ